MKCTINYTMAAGLIFAAGWVTGGLMILSSWEKSAQRGSFEIGQKLYRVTPIN